MRQQTKKNIRFKLQINLIVSLIIQSIATIEQIPQHSKSYMLEKEEVCNSGANSYRICLLLGSARRKNNCQGISEWIERVFTQVSEQESKSQLCNKSYTYFINPVEPTHRPHPQEPVLDETLPSQINDSNDYHLEEVREWSNFIKQSSGIIILSPQYNNGYTSTIKKALDVLFWEWYHKPALVITYGGSGGTQCGDQLRQVLVRALSMNVIDQRIEISLPKEYIVGVKRVGADVKQDKFLLQYEEKLKLGLKLLLLEIEKEK